MPVWDPIYNNLCSHFQTFCSRTPFGIESNHGPSHPCSRTRAVSDGRYPKFKISELILERMSLLSWAQEVF